jgi:gliding motility-associated-like protein
MQNIFKVALLIFLVNNLMAQPLRFYDKVDSTKYTALDLTADDKDGWLTIAVTPDSVFSIVQFDYCGKVITNEKYALPQQTSFDNPQIIYLGKDTSLVYGTLITGSSSKILIFYSVGGIIKGGKLISVTAASKETKPVISIYDHNSILMAFRDETNGVSQSRLVMLDKSLSRRWSKTVHTDGPVRWVKMINAKEFVVADSNKLRRFDTLGVNLWTREVKQRQFTYNSVLRQDSQLIFLADFNSTDTFIKKDYQQIVSVDTAGNLQWQSPLIKNLKSKTISTFNSRLLVDPNGNVLYNAIDTINGDSIPAIYAHTLDAKGNIQNSKRWSAKDSVLDYKSAKLDDGNYGVSILLANSNGLNDLANIKANKAYEDACDTKHDSVVLYSVPRIDTLNTRNINDSLLSIDNIDIIGHHDTFKLNRVCEIFDLKDGKIPTKLCKGDSVFLSGINLKNATYSWANGSKEPGIWVKVAGDYSEQITYCDKTITITYEVTYITYHDEVIDIEECDYPRRLDAFGGQSLSTAKYKWDNGDSTRFRDVSGPGTYSVDVTQCEMTFKRTFNVKLKTFKDETFDLKNICDYPLPLYAYQGANIRGATYLWDDGTTGSARNVNKPGTYKVTVSYCMSQFVQTFNVSSPNYPDQFQPFKNCDFPQILYAPQGDTIKGATYLWDDGSTGASRTISDTGNYKVKVTVCQTSFFVSFRIDYRQYFDETFKFNICKYPDKLYAFYGPDFHNVQYKWDDGTTEEFRTIAGPGTYKVTVNYCKSTFVQTFEISMRDFVELKFPNVFPPNSMIEINKKFKPFPNDSMEITKYNLEVYNRWGKMVYKTTELYSGWDGNYNGEPAPMDTYMYLATMTTKCGDKKYKGTVTLIR